jgi:hypothetical protein
LLAKAVRVTGVELWATRLSRPEVDTLIDVESEDAKDTSTLPLIQDREKMLEITLPSE